MRLTPSPQHVLRYHGMQVGGPGGRYTVFDPPWWKLHLWLWWIWLKYLKHRVARLWRALTPWVKRSVPATQATGLIELRVGSVARSLRVYQTERVWVAWVAPEVTMPGEVDKRPDYELPPSTNVHPSERGL